MRQQTDRHIFDKFPAPHTHHLKHHSLSRIRHRCAVRSPRIPSRSKVRFAVVVPVHKTGRVTITQRFDKKAHAARRCVQLYMVFENSSSRIAAAAGHTNPPTFILHPHSHMYGARRPQPAKQIRPMPALCLPYACPMPALCLPYAMTIIKKGKHHDSKGREYQEGRRSSTLRGPRGQTCGSTRGSQTWSSAAS